MTEALAFYLGGAFVLSFLAERGDSRLTALLWPLFPLFRLLRSARP